MPDRPETLLAQRAWLVALARQLVGPGQVPEEVAHDAMTAAVTSPSQPPVTPRPWLASILRRHVAGERRAEHRRRAREALAARPESQPSASDTVLRFELQRDIANAVLALPEPYRTTVLLRFWEALSPRAIARRLDVPVETVRTRQKRALELLRQRLDRTHGGDRRAWAVPLLALRTASLLSILTGALLMHTTLKFGALAAIAVAAMLVVWAPWSPQGTATAAVDAPTRSANVAVSPETARDDSPMASAEAVAARTTATAAWLEVTGVAVDDDTGAPLPGCEVQLVGWPQAEDADISGRTGNDGTFTLRDARPRPRNGRRIVVRAEDRAPARAQVPFESQQQELQCVDVGTVRVAVGTQLSGRVCRHDDTPVAGAELRIALSSFGYSPFGRTNLLEHSAVLSRSDATGRFTLGERIVPIYDHHNLLFAVGEDGIGWTTFIASKQRRSDDQVEIRLRPDGALRVHVATADGAPVAGATVRALPRFGPVGIDRSMRIEVGKDAAIRALFTAATDAEGTALLAHLPVGEPSIFRDRKFGERSYELWVDAQGHGEQPLVACTLEPGPTRDVNVRLVARRDVAVTVVVHDDAGAAVPDVHVHVHGEAPAEGRTDALGQLHVSVAAVGHLDVSAARAGHRDAQVGVDLVPGEANKLIELVMARTLPLDGRVVDQTGMPVPDRSIFVDQQMLARTDAEGRFHVDDFPVGPRRLVTAMPGNEERTRWIGQQQPETVDAAHGPVTITLQRRLGEIDLRAAVVDAQSGEALELAQYRVWFFEPTVKMFALPANASHDRGIVSAKSLPAGRWRLDVLAVSGHRGSREFELTLGQPPCELRVELPRPGFLTGRLRGIDVALPATLRVDVAFATHEPGSWHQFSFPGRWRVSPRQTIVGDNDGNGGTLQLQPELDATFRLDSVDPNRDLRLTVIGEGVTGEATVRVPAGGTHDVVIDVRAKAR